MGGVCVSIWMFGFGSGPEYYYLFGSGIVLRVLYQSNFQLLGSASKFDGFSRVTTALDEPILHLITLCLPHEYPL